jgi:hypothetical protein
VFGPRLGGHFQLLAATLAQPGITTSFSTASHLVLTATRAIPPGDGPVLRVATCAVAARSIGILTYISEAAIVLCSLSKERLRSVRRATEGTEPSTRSDQPRKC